MQGMTRQTTLFTDNFKKYLEAHGYDGTPFAGCPKAPQF
jgi:hypothetical protein